MLMTFIGGALVGSAVTAIAIIAGASRKAESPYRIVHAVIRDAISRYQEHDLAGSDHMKELLFATATNEADAIMTALSHQGILAPLLAGAHNPPTQCPHGIGWDDCPECSH